MAYILVLFISLAIISIAVSRGEQVKGKDK